MRTPTRYLACLWIGISLSYTLVWFFCCWSLLFGPDDYPVSIKTILAAVSILIVFLVPAVAGIALLGRRLWGHTTLLLFVLVNLVAVIYSISTSTPSTWKNPILLIITVLCVASILFLATDRPARWQTSNHTPSSEA